MQWTDRIGRRIKLRDLHILQAAAEAGSMAKAAAGLAMSQPAVSYAIAEMEHALGVPLLDRSSQGVIPTAYGRALIDRSIVVFNELRLGISEIGFLADPASGELRIGTTPPMSAIASAVINQLVSKYPRVAFHLINEPTTGLIREIRNRNIELAISRIVGPLEQDLKVDVLFKDQLAVIAGRHNRWVRRRSVDLQELMDEPWALPPTESFLGLLISRAFAAQGLEMPRATVSTMSTYALHLLVANGPFLSVHPGSMLRFPNDHPLLAAVAVNLPAARDPVGLITLRNRSQSPVAKLFVEATRSLVSTITKGRLQRRTNPFTRIGKPSPAAKVSSRR